MRIIDSHSHLNFPQFDDDRSAVIARMREHDIGTILVGTTLATSQECVALAEKHDTMWASVGIHPTEAPLRQAQGKPAEFPANRFKRLAQEDKVVAVGECGLDYYRTSSQPARMNVRSDGESGARSQQKKLFKKHIELAQEVGLPLILHCRSAHDEVLEILEEHEGLQGTVHFFTGTMEQAERYIDMGFYIGFDGPITFTNEYDTIIKEVPLERILVETDAPYAAPAPHRGKRNEPAYVVEIVKKIAQIKEMSFDEVARQTTNNAAELFGIEQ